MIDAHGRWYPNLSNKQVEVFNDAHQRILMCGPRLCGKSIVAVHKLIKHAWMYDNDRCGVFVKSTKVGKIGIWDDIISFALPQWCESLAEEGFKIVKGPAQDGATRMHYVVIQNRHGGTSEIQLHPLHHEDSVAEKMKGGRFGCLLFDEIDNYDTPDVFNISVLQLRQIGLPADKHLWMATCNPAGDENHWLYQKFWLDLLDTTRKPEYLAMFKTYEFTLNDNPFLAEQQLTELKETYKTDPEMYQRYVLGKWVPDARSIHFAGAFRPAFHVKGNIKTEEIIVPTEGCVELIAGWDLGDNNHGVVFLEHVQSAVGDYWTILDYVRHVKEDVSIETVTFEVMQKMQELKEYAGGKALAFKHWSDRSAFDRYRSAADARDHILVNQYSGGAIELIGCPKPPHSVQARLSLVRSLLVTNRLFVSANCQPVIDMFNKLSRGKTKGEPIRREAQGHIHIFDAMSYALYGESIDSLEISMRPKVDKSEYRVISTAR